MADDSAQVPLLVEGSSSSEPVPVPGSHAFSISVRLRDRIVPESPANQSSGQPGASSSADTDNEMQAVEARYTDCVGRQDLLGSTQELYRLVARLAGFASGSDPHPFTREEAAGAARCIDLFVMETASDSSARSSSLSTTAEDLSLHRFYAAIGDHAGVLCEALRNAKDAPLLQRPWTIILPELESEERRLTAWEASSRDVPRPRTPYTDALEARVETLFAQGMTDLDTDLALFAVRTYVKRNSLFHGRTYDLFKCGRFAQLADQLDLDDENLAGLLPDKEKPLVDKYRRLIRFNKESRICTDDAGNWVKRKAPPPEVPDKFVPPSKPALRASLELDFPTAWPSWAACTFCFLQSHSFPQAYCLRRQGHQTAC